MTERIDHSIMPWTPQDPKPVGPAYWLQPFDQAIADRHLRAMRLFELEKPARIHEQPLVAK